jgi:profilin
LGNPFPFFFNSSFAQTDVPGTRPKKEKTEDQKQRMNRGWDAHVMAIEDSGEGKLKAAVMGHDGYLWAISSGMKLKPEEAKAIAAVFKDDSKARSDGIRINDEKFLFIGLDGNLYNMKNQERGATVFKTHQTILLGVYSKPLSGGEAAEKVGAIADMLMEQDF